MEEKQTESKKVEQRAFSVMDMRKYNIKYGKDKIARYRENNFLNVYLLVGTVRGVGNHSPKEKED